MSLIPDLMSLSLSPPFPAPPTPLPSQSTRHTVATLQRQVFQQCAAALEPQIQEHLLWAHENAEADAPLPARSFLPSTRHTVATLQRQVFQQRAAALDPQIQEALLWADKAQESHEGHEAPVAAAAATDSAAASDGLSAGDALTAPGRTDGADDSTVSGGNGAARPAPVPVGRRLVVTAQFPDLASGAVRSVRGLLVGQLEALPPFLQEEGEDWAEEGESGEEGGSDIGRELIRAQYDPTDQSELAMSAADGRQLVGRYLWPDGRQEEADETAGWQRAAKLKLFLPPVPEMLQGWLSDRRRQQQVTEMGRCEYEEGKVGRRVEALRRRIAGMQPAGWQEFVQVVQVLAQAEALDPESSTLMPLGEIAAKVRGVNELWIAVALSHPSLPRLSPPAIAGCCAALVSEGMRMRTGDGSSPSFPYEPSWEVQEWVYEAEERRDWLMQLQLAANVAIPADLDAQFAGVVEAWAQGVTWRQLIADCAGLDEGDIARLLRRTIDLLSQIPYLPGIDPSLAKAAKQSAYVMERPPISELIG
ncbi:unnamed protein product [Closterium sp. Yama58-4]|nr:unnamed protein product [Closterium sp. Yama58-4]